MAKSPVVVGRSADMEKTTDAIMTGKMLNAGQICLAPDYVFVPQEKMQEFVESTQRSVAKMYPTLLDNPDYTSIVNDRHYDRINGYLDEARAKGVDVVEINPAGEDFRQQPNHKIPPTLVIDPADDLAIMQEEIFGPVMPVKPYQQVEETVGYINDHPRPLGLYYFGTDDAEQDRVVSHTTSGGVTVNDVVMHVAQEDLPFGGVGAVRHGGLSRARWVQDLQPRQGHLQAEQGQCGGARRPAAALRRQAAQGGASADEVVLAPICSTVRTCSALARAAAVLLSTTVTCPILR